MTSKSRFKNARKRTTKALRTANAVPRTKRAFERDHNGDPMPIESYDPIKYVPYR